MKLCRCAELLLFFNDVLSAITGVDILIWSVRVFVYSCFCEHMQVCVLVSVVCVLVCVYVCEFVRMCVSLCVCV